jgi:ribosomal protein S18 acetylase RimI-like enzyme
MDDNIIADDIYLYSKEEPNRLYILSVVIDPEYQNSNAVNVLVNAFIVFLREKENTGYPIERLLVSCISEDGSKLFSRLRFHYEKQLEDDYCLYTCEGPSLKDLLQKGCVRRKPLTV